MLGVEAARALSVGVAEPSFLVNHGETGGCDIEPLRQSFALTSEVHKSYICRELGYKIFMFM